MTTTPYYIDDSVTVHAGDSRDVILTLADCSIDAIVCDPPYELTSGKKGGTGVASINLDSPYGRARIGTGNGAGGFMGKAWDASGIAHDPTFWGECLRVLKPGGYVLAFGGSRTSHRLTAAIEDGGFEIRDSIAWLYGSGFPKSLDVSKAIDKQAGHWRGRAGDVISGNGSMENPNRERTDKGEPVTPAAAAAAAGWGTALKPAFEPIVVGRKPFAGTVASNWLEWGVGALNIDACRTTTGDTLRSGSWNDMRGGHYGSGHRPGEPSAERRYTEQGGTNFAATPGPRGGDDRGRWPTNVVLDASQAALLDAETGTLTSGYMKPETDRTTRQGDAYGQFAARTGTATYGDTGGASRFFPTFHYEAKAPQIERPRNDDGTAHPTVKPLDLMRWLVRLVTPGGGLVLDPFLGSGTTAEACVIEGFRCIGIERDEQYLPLIAARLSKPIQPGFVFGDAS